MESERQIYNYSREVFLLIGASSINMVCSQFELDCFAGNVLPRVMEWGLGGCYKSLSLEGKE